MIWLKDTLEQGPAYGMWITAGSIAVAELVGAAGFDWALVDLEHGFQGEAEALQALVALSGSKTASIVRVPVWNSPQVARMLDFGASAIMAPMIETPEQAAGFAAALRYPPMGRRGMTGGGRGPNYGYATADYVSQANDRITGIAQIESAAGIENVDAIAATPGIDVLFIGHADLSLSYGCYGKFDAPIMRDAEASVLAACAKHGKTAGMILRGNSLAADYAARGFRCLGLGVDMACLRTTFDGLLARARS